MLGSPLGAAADLLHVLLGVFFLLVPFLLTFDMAQRQRRNPLWAVAAAIAGCLGFVGGRALADRWELDAAAWTLLPVLTGLLPSTAIAVTVGRMRMAAGRRRWPVLRLDDRQSRPAMLSVSRAALGLDDGRLWQLDRAEVVAVAAVGATLVVHYRDGNHQPQCLELVPMQDGQPESEAERARAIAARIRRMLRMRDLSGSGPA